MALTLGQLLVVRSVDDWRNDLLNALKGLGIVIKGGIGAGGVGTGTGSLSISGTPLAAFSLIVINIVTAGELGTAQFQYSLDGGSTFSSSQTVPSAPGTFVLPGTGISITFAPGPAGSGTSFTLSDKYTLAINTPSLQVTSWPASSGYRQLVEIESQALAAFSAQQSALAAGGFTTTATGAWADLLGKQFYGLDRNSAAITAGQITLNDANGAGPFTIAIGTMWFASGSGLRYFNTTGGTLPKNGSLNILVSAESPGAVYNVGNGTITSIVAGTLPGVTVNNPDPGTGSWITSQGSDAEGDSAYMLRCQQRWPGLGTGSTAAVYKLWATSSEQAAGHATTITKVLAITDLIVPGQIDVYLAGASGTVGGGAVTDAVNYINPRVPLTAVAVITAASNLVITIAGNVNFYIGKNSLLSIQAAVAKALGDYINALDIGSDSGGTVVKVYFTEIDAAIGSVLGGAGVAIRNITGLLVNGSTADVGLTTGQVATLTNSLTFTGL